MSASNRGISMNSDNMLGKWVKGLEKVDIRNITNWAVLYGVPCGPVAEYCSRIRAGDKLPRGAKKHEQALRKKILERIGLKAVTEELACQGVRPAPDLDAMVDASLDGIQAIAEGKSEIRWSGPY